MENLQNKRFYVKIEAGAAKGGNPCIYINKDFPFPIFIKWKWYFDYIAALYKVKHPKHTVTMYTGSYDFIEPATAKLKNMADKIKGKKATITKYKNLLQQAKENWCELFPIEDDSDFIKAQQKIQRLEAELLVLFGEMEKLEN